MAEEPIGLGPRLLRAREYRGLSQRELARRARLSVTQVSRIESEERANPDSETIRRMAEVLRVSMDYLYGLVDEFRTLDGPGETIEDLRAIPCV